MNRSLPACILVAAACAPCVAQSADPARSAWTLASCLLRLADDSWLCRPPAVGERAVQFSSFDRKSLAGPTDPGAWYANDDRGKYLRVETRDGKPEHVLAEVDGPGVVTRIWSANPSGTITFAIDGARVWSVDFAQLCEGKVEGLGEPFCGMRSKGGNSYVPIPFAKSLVVTATAGDLYYHVNVLCLPAGSVVESFAPEQVAAARAAFVAAATALADAPRPGVARDGEGAAACEVPPRGVVRRFSVAVPAAPGGKDLGELLRRFELVVEHGDETTVRVPLLDFFAGGADWRPHGGRYLRIDDERVAHCGFRMPMPDGGRIRVVGDGGTDGFAPRLVGVEIEAGAARPDDLLFRASFHLRKGFRTRPFHDHLVLYAKGASGRFVGCALLVKNPQRAWWGEGDEKFWVDGESFPSTFGTGTEDYFGYAWCDPTPFQSALHGQAQCDGPMNFGFCATHRVHLLDAVPFQSSFRFELEAWHWAPAVQMDYATVAYWYAGKGAASGLPKFPDADALGLDRLQGPKVRKIDGALEAESLRVLSCTGGKHESQETWWAEELCSGDKQLWWMDGKVGDELTLAFPVAQAGRHRLRAAFVRAVDYGIVQCVVAGAAVGEPIDLYSADIARTGLVELGVVELPAGEGSFTLRLVGQNAAAQPRRMVGLDCLVLEKLP